MKQLFIVSYIFLIGGFVSAQKIAKEMALEDLDFLNKAVTFGHPVNFNPSNPKVTLNEVVQKLQNLERDSLELAEFRLLIHEAIFKIGCVHTRISSAGTNSESSAKVFFPRDIFFVDGKLVDSTSTEVLAINGVSAKTIIRDVDYFYASDGATNALSTSIFGKNTVQLISRYFDFCKSYTITTDEGTVALDARKELLKMDAPKLAETVIFENETNLFYLTEGIAVLKVSSFHKSDKSFFRNAFDYLHEHPAQSLIIDLRGNLGGNRKSAVFLTKNLVPNPFNYSILQPKLDTKKYLDGKGKFFLFLSKLKYNVGNVGKGKRTDLGKEFSYTFKPVKNNFNGKLVVLTDGYTASASTMVSSWLKQQTKAVFIGQQSGGGYSGNNGGSFPTLTLPNSNYHITFPAYRLILDENSDQNEGIQPDVYMEQTISAEDNVLIQTLQLIHSNQ